MTAVIAFHGLDRPPRPVPDNLALRVIAEAVREDPRALRTITTGTGGMRAAFRVGRVRRPRGLAHVTLHDEPDGARIARTVAAALEGIR